jgi:hypothetical protein
MDKSQTILQELSDLKGFKKYFKGGLFSGSKKAMAAEALWQAAEAKGVFPVVQIADLTAEAGVSQIVYAFTTDGSVLTDEVLDKLAGRAKHLTPEQLKAGDRSWVMNFEPLIPPAGHPFNKNGDTPPAIHYLADGLDNVRTFLHVSLFFDAGDRAKSKAEYVIYIKNGDGEFLRLLEKRHV